MIIGGLQKTTLIDYPGKIAATVFLTGCNFRCPWCYSSELVLPEKIKKQPKISEKEFFAFLKGKRGLLDGIVLCGGEPTLNKDLPDFIKKIRKMGFLIKLDTNGSSPEMLKNLIRQKLVDYIAMDVKAPLEAQSANLRPELRSRERKAPRSRRSASLRGRQNYERATGVKADIKKIKKSIEIIKNFGIDYEFRTTMVPGIHSKEDIIKMTKQIGPAKAYFLQGFRAEKTLDPKFKNVKPYPKEYLLEASESVKAFFTICKVR